MADTETIVLEDFPLRHIETLREMDGVLRAVIRPAPGEFEERGLGHDLLSGAAKGVGLVIVTAATSKVAELKRRIAERRVGDWREDEGYR